MKQFSLIIPFHNRSDHDRRNYIDDLLDSLPDREDLEIILVDDHSEILYEPGRDFARASLRVVPNRPGRRFAGTARNTGMEESQGDVLFFADSDDLFDTEGLSQVMNAVASEQEADLVIARTTSFFEDGRQGDRHLYIERTLQRYLESGSYKDLVRYHSPVGKFISRSFIFGNNLEYGSTRVANDVLFGVGLALSRPRVRVEDAVIYRIRQGNDSLTRDQGADAARERIEVARAVHDLMCDLGEKDLRSPLHYVFRKYLRQHKNVVLRQAWISLLRGDRIVSPPWKMLRTIAKS